MTTGITAEYFLLVNCTISIPVNKVRNMTITLNRKRIPVEISMCTIGLYVLTRLMQRQYTMQNIMLSMTGIYFFMPLFIYKGSQSIDIIQNIKRMPSPTYPFGTAKYGVNHNSILSCVGLDSNCFHPDRHPASKSTNPLCE